MVFKKIIDKYRKEAWDYQNNEYKYMVSLRHAILESIFAPKFRAPPGKGPMTHLHPDMDKLHLPPGINLPDWRKYRVEDHPALVNFQKRCHAAGLHDPWLRNYAFRWYPNMLTKRSRMALATIGCAWGFGIASVLYAGEKIYDHFYPTVYLHTPEYTAKYGNEEVYH